MQGYIAGVLLNSETLWPRNTSVVIFFSGCDFKCPSCIKPTIIDFKEEFLIDIKDVKEVIKANSHISNSVLFAGGEPSLQRDALLELARYSKMLSLKTGIETNGSKPIVLRQLIRQGLINFVSLDFKAPLEPVIFEKITNSKTFFVDTEEILMNLRRTLAILKNNNDKIQLQFKTTIIPSLLYKKEEILKMARIIRHFNSTWKLEQFNPKVPTLDQNLKNFNSVSPQFMENLKESCLEQYPNLRIQIVSCN